MKIRMGFVSNSSSGSFVIHWRIRGMGQTFNKEAAVAGALDLQLQDGKIVDEEGYNKEIIEIAKEIIENTAEYKENTFVSTFSTSMVNYPGDYGEAAKLLLIALVVYNSTFEIIDTNTVGD